MKGQAYKRTNHRWCVHTGDASRDADATAIKTSVNVTWCRHKHKCKKGKFLFFCAYFAFAFVVASQIFKCSWGWHKCRRRPKKSSPCLHCWCECPYACICIYVCTCISSKCEHALMSRENIYTLHLNKPKPKEKFRT